MRSVAYRTIKNVLSPRAPTDVSFNDIVKEISAHLQPTPSETVQRYKFHSRTRRQGESVAAYVAELKKLSQHCNFGTALDGMIRDRLICGVGDEHWQRRLLSEATLTYDTALKLALALEAAEQQVKDMQSLKAAPVHHVSKTWGGGGGRVAIPVSLAEPESEMFLLPVTVAEVHKPSDCRFKNADCNYCKKKGHIAKVCRSKARDLQRKDHREQGSHRKRRTHQVTTGEEDSDAAEYTNNHTSERTKPLLVDVKINDANTRMEVDTGATLSIISQDTYRSLWSSDCVPPLRPSSAKLKTYTGEVIAVEGTINVNVVYKDQTAKVNLLVVAGNGPSLMRRDWLKHLRLDWSQLHQVRASKQQWQEVLDRHATVFKDEVGMLQGTTVKIHIDPQAQSKFYRPRSVPYALRDKVGQELGRREREGHWTSSIFSHSASCQEGWISEDLWGLQSDHQLSGKNWHVPSSSHWGSFRQTVWRHHILNARLSACLPAASSRSELKRLYDH